MDVSSFTRKPDQVTGVLFDGTLASALEVVSWVEADSGLKCALARAIDGALGLYIPTPLGTAMLNAGDTLIRDSKGAYWPTRQAVLDADYERNQS